MWRTGIRESNHYSRLEKRSRPFEQFDNEPSPPQTMCVYILTACITAKLLSKHLFKRSQVDCECLLSFPVVLLQSMVSYRAISCSASVFPCMRARPPEIQYSQDVPYLVKTPCPSTRFGRDTQIDQRGPPSQIRRFLAATRLIFFAHPEHVSSSMR